MSYEPSHKQAVTVVELAGWLMRVMDALRFGQADQ